MRPTDLATRGKRAATTVINAPLAALSFGAGLVIGGVRAAVGRLGGRPPVPPPVPSTATSPPSPDRREEPGAPGEAIATEPTAVSRDSAHGRAADDARIDEWYAEHDTGPDVDVETPVGTTAADVGYNPDTGETDLRQPDTEPLLDPGTAKAIRSESETMRRAADLDPD